MHKEPELGGANWKKCKDTLRVQLRVALLEGEGYRNI